MFKEPVVIVDIETSGGNTKNSRIIEIAALRIENNEVVDKFTSLVNPGTRIPEFITQLTGICNEDVADAPYFEDIAAGLVKIFDGALFMAHYAVFDFSFVKRQMEGCGYEFKPKLLCSVKLSRALYPQHKGHSLEKIIARHGLEVASRHRAFDDAKAVLDFSKMAFQEHGPELFSRAVVRQLKLVSLPSNFDERYLEGISNVPGVYIFKNDNKIPVYIGKSVSLRNRILSHFTQSTKLDKELQISQNTHTVEVIETSGELEALLLESKLIKEMLPVYNRRLRRKKNQIVLSRKLNDHGYYEIDMIEANVSEFTKPDEIFGVYNNRLQAKEALQKARKTFDLCSKLLGLEKSSKACFYYQLKKCKGACIKIENATLYNHRLDTAFERSRIENWKYKKPVVIQLNPSAGLVVDQWKIVGRIECCDDSEPTFEELRSDFDMDNYKILRSYFARKPHTLQPLNSIINLT